MTGVARALVVAASCLVAAVASARAALPSAAECASGRATGVALGANVGSAAACVGTGDHVVLYAAGNPAAGCGTIVVADQPTPAKDEPNECDTLGLDRPDRLDFGLVLPSGYDRGERRYPVLYLLSSVYPSEWPAVDRGLQAIADLGVIIVLPNQGFGWYADWVNGAHRFETLDTTALIRWVDTHLRTIPDRAHRAIAGSSKAGYGAMMLAARHPDLYAAVAAFSGVLDIADTRFRLHAATALAPSLAPYSDPAAYSPIWGDPVTYAVGWHACNPADLATNLRGVAIYHAVGDGTTPPDELAASGPGDAGPGAAQGSEQEAEFRLMNDDFARRLDAAGIAHTYVRHAGSHDPYYWVPELHQWAPMMMDVFAHPAAPPPAFDYRSTDPTFAAWGWMFRADPARAEEFLDVTHASARGLTLTGSGVTTVTTAPIFRPEQSVVVTPAGGAARTVRASHDGRVTFSVGLGAPHPARQYTPQADALARTPGYWTTRTVILKPASAT